MLGGVPKGQAKSQWGSRLAKQSEGRAGERGLRYKRAAIVPPIYFSDYKTVGSWAKAGFAQAALGFVWGALGFVRAVCLIGFVLLRLWPCVLPLSALAYWLLVCCFGFSRVRIFVPASLWRTGGSLFLWLLACCAFGAKVRRGEFCSLLIR